MFRHLEITGKSYRQHGAFAFRAGLWLFWAGITSIIHAIFPDVFPFTSEKIVMRLLKEAQIGRRMPIDIPASDTPRPH